MRLEDNTYYVNYSTYKDGREGASMCHYIKVWDNGFWIDDYGIDENGFSYEDASWTGINPDDSLAGKRIKKRKFETWVRIMEAAKNRIEEIVKANCPTTPIDRELKIGDYLYYPFKEIFAEELAAEREEFGDEEDYNEEDYEEDRKYEGPDLMLFHITDIKDKEICGTRIIVDEWDTSYRPEPDWRDLEYEDKAFFITKEVFEEALRLIRSSVAAILPKIKQAVVK